MKAAQSPETKTGRRVALLCLSMSMILASLGTSIANIALPTLALVFDVPFHQVQWIVIAYLASMTLFVVIAGRLGDVFGRQRMLVIGLALFSLASLFCGLASGLWMLVAIAILTPGYQMFQSANNVMAMADVSADQRGAVSGLLGLSRNIGLISGGSVMGAVFSAGVGSTTIEDATYGAMVDGLQITFLLGGLLILIALWFTRRLASDKG